MRVHILVLEEVFDTGLAALLDTLGVANDLALGNGEASLPFDLSVIGVRQRVRTSRRFSVPLTSPRPDVAPDILLIPALDAKTPGTLRLALARRDVSDACKLLRQLSEKARTANGVNSSGA